MAAKSISAPAQPKQPSRKGKKAWRKNVDITEVQLGLEALREEIIQGGPISEKPSDELFAFDTLGSNDIKTKYRLSKPLKVDEILAKRSAVPVVDSRKRLRVTDGVVESSNKRTKKDWVSKKEVARLRQVADRITHLDSERVNIDDAAFDMWAAAPTETNTDRASEYLPKIRAKVAPTTIKQAPGAMTASGKPVKAVRNPDAGTSYNPSFDEWDDLLNRVGAAEVAAEQVRLAQAQAETEKQARVDAVAAAVDEAATRADNESEWEGFETEAEVDGDDQELDDVAMLRQRRPKRKTPAERNKINRRKEMERQTKHQKKMEQKQRSVNEMMQSILAASEDDGQPHTLVAVTTTTGQGPSHDDGDGSSGDDTKLRRRKLGNQHIPEKSLELVLPDELQESLRQLKPEGNLLQDRFRNLLVNGKVESRKPVLQHKKRKVKLTEKWSYKDFSVAV